MRPFRIVKRLETFLGVLLGALLGVYLGTGVERATERQKAISAWKLVQYEYQANASMLPEQIVACVSQYQGKAIEADGMREWPIPSDLLNAGRQLSLSLQITDLPLERENAVAGYYMSVENFNNHVASLRHFSELAAALDKTGASAIRIRGLYRNVAEQGRQVLSRTDDMREITSSQIRRLEGSLRRYQVLLFGVSLLAALGFLVFIASLWRDERHAAVSDERQVWEKGA